MGKLVVSENVCLDGVVQDPIGEDGFERGGWFTQMSRVDRQAWADVEYAEAVGADALLLGRRTDDFFARTWNTREGTWADRLRSLPKYVVSSTAVEGEWVNSTVLRGPVLEEAARLKELYHRDVVVYGSHQLVRALFEHHLVDELRLTVHPFVVGTGELLFAESGSRTSLRLLGARTLGENLVHLSYAVVRT